MRNGPSPGLASTYTKATVDRTRGHPLPRAGEGNGLMQFWPLHPCSTQRRNGEYRRIRRALKRRPRGHIASRSWLLPRRESPRPDDIACYRLIPPRSGPRLSRNGRSAGVTDRLCLSNMFPPSPDLPTFPTPLTFPPCSSAPPHLCIVLRVHWQPGASPPIFPQHTPSSVPLRLERSALWTLPESSHR